VSEGYTGFGSIQHGQDDMSLMMFIAQQAMNGMATGSIVEVMAVDATAKTVDVKPMVHQSDGAGKIVEHGTIHALPYFTLRAGNAAIIAAPVKGDIGFAAFTNSDSSGVKKTKKAAAPGTRRRFDWADGFYFGGFLGPTPTTIITVSDATGVTVTVPSGKKITLNGDVDIVGDVTVSKTLTATTDVVGGGKSLKNHTHSGVTTGGGTSGPPS
jgi:hypothetical protein